MNAISDFSAAYATNPAAWGESGAVPIGVLVAAKLRQIRQVRKLRTHPTPSSSRP